MSYRHNLPISGVSALEAGQRKVDALELFMLAKLYNKPIGWFFKEYSEDTSENGSRGSEEMDPMLKEWLPALLNASSPMQRKIAYHIMIALGQK